LNAPGVDDDGLKELSKLELPVLEALNLRGIAISDKGLDYLQGLKNLRRVDVRKTLVTMDGIKKLETAMPDLTIVHSLG